MSSAAFANPTSAAVEQLFTPAEIKNVEAFLGRPWTERPAAAASLPLTGVAYARRLMDEQQASAERCEPHVRSLSGVIAAISLSGLVWFGIAYLLVRPQSPVLAYALGGYCLASLAVWTVAKIRDLSLEGGR